MNELLTGQDALIARLEDENARLRRELAAKDQEIRSVESQNTAAIKNLRRQLSPLYTALQQVFGEIDVLVSPEDNATPNVDARTKAVWESWKDKLGVGAAKCIDALLLHGELNTQQLSIATGYHRNTVPQYVSALNTAGLINKRDGKFSLKQL